MLAERRGVLEWYLCELCIVGVKVRCAARLTRGFSDDCVVGPFYAHEWCGHTCCGRPASLVGDSRRHLPTYLPARAPAPAPILMQILILIRMTMTMIIIMLMIIFILIIATILNILILMPICICIRIRIRIRARTHIRIRNPAASS